MFVVNSNSVEMIKRLKKNIKDTKPAVDAHKTILFPLDYSFKAIGEFSEVLLEKPRGRDAKFTGSLEDEMASDADKLIVTQSNAEVVKLNNNMLSEWEGFSEMFHTLLISPLQLSWIDLSFNDFKNISSALLEFSNLSVLYFHANNVSKLSEVEKLASLPNLRSLALHGNPIENSEGYKQYVISRIPQLKSLDFATIIRSDRVTADVWKKMISPKKTKKTKVETT